VQSIISAKVKCHPIFISIILFALLRSSVDFPHDWDSLLPTLTQHFESDHFGVLLCSLKIANSVLSCYRNIFKIDQVLDELKLIMAIIQEPLHHLYCRITRIIIENTVSRDQIADAFRAQILMTKIFFSLNFVDLPKYFEDHMEEWMRMFLTFLSYQTTERKSLFFEKSGINT
jgi:exportin-2 (importin alpha re-exporter)